MLHRLHRAQGHRESRRSPVESSSWRTPLPLPRRSSLQQWLYPLLLLLLMLLLLLLLLLPLLLPLLLLLLLLLPRWPRRHPPSWASGCACQSPRLPPLRSRRPSPATAPRAPSWAAAAWAW